MLPTSSGPLPAVENIDDVIELTYSGLVVTDRQARTHDRPDELDEQFFVEWEVPEEG
ncbi:MAG: hypothetical protein ACLGI2_16540 [Acidimicrobiia bacterium]